MFPPAGTMGLPTGFSPYVEFKDRSQQWKWIGKIDESRINVKKTFAL